MPLPIPTVRLVATLGASGVALIIFVAYCLPLALVRVERGINDPEAAKANFRRILHAAQSELLIFDDGDASDCSLYQDKELVDEIHNVLKVSSIKMRCLFTFDDELLLTQTLLSSSDNIDFGVRITNQPREEVHFKIADSGMLVYLTRHEKGACKRPFTLINCSWVPKFFRHVKNRISKEYIDAFNLGFTNGVKVT